MDPQTVVYPFLSMPPSLPYLPIPSKPTPDNNTPTSLCRMRLVAKGPPTCLQAMFITTFLRSLGSQTPRYPTGRDSPQYEDHSQCCIGPIDVTPSEMPGLYDILLSDVDEEILFHEVSEALGRSYLSQTLPLSTPMENITGIVWGTNSRVFFPLVVALPRAGSPSYVVHFLYDSGCPHVFLSHKACDILFDTNPIPRHFTLKMNGQRTLASLSNPGSHFEEVNIVGSNFCASLGLEVMICYEAREAVIRFPPNGAPPAAPAALATPTTPRGERRIRKQPSVDIRAGVGQSNIHMAKGKGKDGGKRKDDN